MGLQLRLRDTESLVSFSIASDSRTKIVHVWTFWEGIWLSLTESSRFDRGISNFKFRNTHCASAFSCHAVTFPHFPADFEPQMLCQLWPRTTACKTDAKPAYTIIKLSHSRLPPLAGNSSVDQRIIILWDFRKLWANKFYKPVGSGRTPVKYAHFYYLTSRNDCHDVIAIIACFG